MISWSQLLISSFLLQSQSNLQVMGIVKARSRKKDKWVWNLFRYFYHRIQLQASSILYSVGKSKQEAEHGDGQDISFMREPKFFCSATHAILSYFGPGVLACATRGGGRSEAGHCFHLLFSFFLSSPPSTFHPLRGISRAWKFVSPNILA